jgi:hypothetical protein
MKLRNLTREQQKIAKKIVLKGRSMGAKHKEIIAALETGLVESNLRNLNYGHADSKGWRQEREMYYKNPTNLDASITRFFQETKAKRDQYERPAALAQAVQRSAFPSRYAERRKDAGSLLRSIDKKGGGSTTVRLPGIPDREVKQYGTKETPTFDEQGFEQAQRRQLVAQMLSKRNPDSVLFKSGLLSTEAPDPSEFMDTRQEITERTEVMKGVKGQKVKVPGGGKGGKVRGGGGYSGTKGIADAAIGVAKNMGIQPSSLKRSTKYTDSGNISDHWEGAKGSYAADLPAIGETGDRLAARIARRYGIKDYSPGNYAGYTVRGAGGKRYRVQILWRVAGHGPTGPNSHVHVGVRAL